jgi:hypothetical protein
MRPALTFNNADTFLGRGPNRRPRYARACWRPTRVRFRQPEKSHMHTLELARVLRDRQWRCQQCLRLRPRMSPHGLRPGIFQLILNVFWCLEMWGRIVPELPLELYSSRGNQVRLKCHFRMVPLCECSVCVSTYIHMYIYIYIYIYMYIREVELVSSNLTNLPNYFHHLWHWSALSSDLAVRDLK